jgi:hypothetical protein
MPQTQYLACAQSIRETKGNTMRFIKALWILLGISVLTACTVGQQITDFSDRSVGYVYINLDEASGNKVVGGAFRNLGGDPNNSFFPIGARKFGDGFLLYHIGLPNGPTKLAKVDTMFCIGLCGNTINSFDFGAQGGDVAAVNIRSRGVYDFGSYQIVSQSGGLFRPGTFDVRSTRGPSRRQVLEFLLQDAGDEQRALIQAALNQL